MDSELQKIESQLSEQGILYISSGFDGPYILQVMACRTISPTEVQLCLTDGTLYIGGKYIAMPMPEIPQYSVVKV